MKILLISLFLLRIVESFREPILRTNNVTISLRFKSVKCYVNDPSIVLIKFCFIKAHSRTLATLNIGVNLHKDVPGPIDVSILVERRFITTYREIKKLSVNYCELVKGGKFVTTNPLYLMIYNFVKDSIPPIAYSGCPFPKGKANLTHFHAPIQTLPFSQLVPSGLYRVILNVSSKGNPIGSGYGTGELNSPLKFWS